MIVAKIRAEDQQNSTKKSDVTVLRYTALLMLELHLEAFHIREQRFLFILRAADQEIL